MKKIQTISIKELANNQNYIKPQNNKTKQFQYLPSTLFFHHPKKSNPYIKNTQQILQNIQIQQPNIKHKKYNPLLIHHKIAKVVQKYFDQNSQIDIEASVNSFYHLGIFQHLKTISQIHNVQSNSNKFKNQIIFLKNLWDIINAQTINGTVFIAILNAIIYDQILDKSILKQYQQINRLIQSWKQQQTINQLNPIKQIPIIKFSQTANLKQKNENEIQHLFTRIRISQDIGQRDKKQNNEYFRKQNSVQLRQKDVVKRLYQTSLQSKREIMKRTRQQQRQIQELKWCTFKPRIIKKQVRIQEGNSVLIKNFDKTIERLRQAHEKNKEMKELKQHIPRGENYEKLRNRNFNPPSFLSRQRQRSIKQQILFYIQVELNRRKVRINIRKNESAQCIVNEIERIYHINKETGMQLLEVIKVEMRNYKKSIQKK